MMTTKFELGDKVLLKDVGHGTISGWIFKPIFPGRWIVNCADGKLVGADEVNLEKIPDYDRGPWLPAGPEPTLPNGERI
jgi:hypothetical protein